jgi:hypothetical protein
MSKKIDAASRALQDAVKEHAKWLARGADKPEKLEKAAWRLRAAARAYTDLLSSRTGTTSPFVGIPSPELDDISVGSLSAERDRLKNARLSRERATAADTRPAHHDGTAAGAQAG